MRSVTKWYTGFITGLGLLVGAGCVWRFFTQRAGTWTPALLLTFLVLLLLYWGCCCLLLYLRDDCTVDLSFLSVLAAVLLLGPEAAVVINLITYFFVVVPSPDGRGYEHARNTALYKTFFNLSMRNLSYMAGGLVYYAAGGIPGSISLPGVLPSALLFIALSMIANVFIIVIYFRCEGLAKIYPTFFQMFGGLLPSIGLSAPIGYFLAMLLTMRGGVWLALLFMLPLLLARYSFKLYLTSQKHQEQIIRTLTAALEAKDTYTEGHSQCVSEYTVKRARRLGLSAARVKTLETAAIFHDIGKSGVPDSILQKPGILTPEERSVIRGHPEQGVHILESLDGYQDIIPLVLHHHEFYDGRGYPGGTSGEEIPLDTYILSAADAYDAITSDRPYRAGRTPAAAAAILREEAGKQFHPQVALVVAEMAESGELSRPESEPSAAPAKGG